MARPPVHPRRAGLTLLEVMLSVLLLSILTVKIYDAVSVARESTTRQTEEVVLEDQARRVLRQIGYAVMGSDRETLLPNAEWPLSANLINYRVNLGVQDGEVVWSDQERIAKDQLQAEVAWSQNPDTEAERRVVWTRMVAPFLEGELPNGMDDNGNGLIDETGLSFSVRGDSVTIRMTLERVGDDGEVTRKTVETTVTCRNLGEAAG